MKIAYFDLNEGPLFEDYAYDPKNYGGGRIIAASLLEKFSDFHVYGYPNCFENVRFNKKQQCFVLDLDTIKKIKFGYPINQLLPQINQYDIIFHHTYNISINRSECPNIIEVVWPVGWRETVHHNIKHILAFDRDHQETVYPSDANIYDIVIGPQMPTMQEILTYEKEDFIFQCSRHCDMYQSILLAQICNKHSIKAYFAGPIDPGYPLLNFIDNKNTFYLGSIPEKLKIDLYKRSKVNTQLQNYPISVTLSGKQAAGYGNIIFATNIGGWKDYIKNGVNGFFVNNEDDFIEAWKNRNAINPLDCNRIASEHSENNMINSVIKALNQIEKNKNA
jgi:hypothetical protein